MLRRAGATGIDGVQIHFAVIKNVARHHRALQEMDIVEHVADLGRVMQVLQSGIAIGLAVGFDHMHGCARRAVMHARVREFEIMPPIAAV